MQYFRYKSIHLSWHHKYINGYFFLFSWVHTCVWIWLQMIVKVEVNTNVKLYTILYKFWLVTLCLLLIKRFKMVILDSKGSDECIGFTIYKFFCLSIFFLVKRMLWFSSSASFWWENEFSKSLEYKFENAQSWQKLQEKK